MQCSFICWNKYSYSINQFVPRLSIGVFYLKNAASHIFSCSFAMRQNELQTLDIANWRGKMVSEIILLLEILQPTFNCTKSTLEMPVQCVKYVQRYNTDTRKMYVLMYLLITLITDCLQCSSVFHCWLKTSKCQLGWNDKFSEIEQWQNNSTHIRTQPSQTYLSC